MRLESGVEVWRERRWQSSGWTGWICVGIAAGIFATTVWTIVRAYLPLPMFDQWEELTVGDHLAKLFSPHNEHVIFFPRLVFLVDKEFFGGASAFNQAVTFAVQLVCASLVWAVARRAGLPKWVSAGVVFSTFFWCYHAENFLSGFQVTFVGVGAAVTAALVTLGLLKERGVGWAIALSFVATLTMSNGLLAGILLVSLGICLGLARRQIAILNLGAAATIGTYVILSHLSRPPNLPAQITAGRLGNAVAHPWRLIAYAGAYLGGPFGRLLFRNSIHGDAAMGVTGVIGLGGLAALVLVGALIWRRRLGALEIEKREIEAQLILVHIALFAVLTAGLTALGRAQDFPLYQAASLRYGAVALVFWLCLGFLIWRLASGWLARGNALGAAVATCACLVMAASQPFIMRLVLTSPVSSRTGEASEQAHAIAGRLGDRQDALTTILSGVDDREALSSIYPEPEALSAKIPKLRAARMAPFNEKWSAWLGSDLGQHVQVASENCPAKNDSATSVRGNGWHVSGLEEGSSGHDRRRIVLVSERGVVVGYGLRSPGTVLKEALTGSSLRWSGYASGENGSTVTGYALNDSGSLACSIGPVKLGSGPTVEKSSLAKSAE